MKFQYFLRGLGVGIVLAAIVLCVTYRTDGNGNVDVVEEAKKLGMVFPEGTQAPENKQDSVLTPTAEPIVTAEPVSSPAVSGAGVTGNAATDSEGGETAKPTAKLAKKEKSSSGKDTIKFTVKSGLLSSSVAREMKKAGIIKDADDFDQYLEESGYSRKIRSGTYSIPSGASYEEIAKIITRQ